MTYPSKEDYLKLSKTYNLIPVFTEIVVDMETPISIYKKVCHNQPGFLLESVEGGEKLARYSFIGFDPFMKFSCKDGKGEIIKDGNKRAFTGSPFDELEKIINEVKVPEMEEFPRFYGGAVGYFGYDMIRYIEELPQCKGDELELPDCQFIFPSSVLIFDHVKHKMKIVCITRPGTGQGYDNAVERIAEINNRIQCKTPLTHTNATYGVQNKITANLTKKDFVEMVAKAKEFIKAGDIFQVVLSRRFCLPLNKDPFNIYRTLRVVNPAPYLYYLDFDDIKIIGSSPEMFIRVDGNNVETCPIAGTRPRGQTIEDDLAMEKELLQDKKERAEHLMLVDLSRNDLGRVCKCGTIEVSDFMKVQKYSHVIHLVSAVKGHLKKDKTVFDAIKACFPAGTLSGAPKIRAMEIIEQLEPTKRGIYGGVIGYLGFNGNLDTCITIRSILVHHNNAYFQSGAGVVADSDPEKEYQETINKAKALIETLLFKEVG